MRLAIRLGWVGAISAEKGARTALWAATAPELSAVSGKYFARCAALESSAASYDIHVQHRLWELSERLTGLAPAP